MTNQEFIDKIAPLHIKYAKKYGYNIVSAAIGQACLESAYGTSDKAQHNNYYGLKYRPNRVTTSNGTFESKSKEQLPDGSYIEKTFIWYSFPNMDAGVEGYYQFINISRYTTAKTATNPRDYLQALKNAGYASSINYVDNIMAVVDKWNLTKYDAMLNPEPVQPTGFTNSSLICYTNLSPNYNPRSNRGTKILKITPHHMAGNITIERCGEIFANPNRKGSSNYGIGTDGRIGLYVEEKNRAWTSGNADNDYVAVTIEVANDGGAPDWHVSDKALESLINLCVDICKRNGIKQLNYTGDKTGNLTMHCMFQATACPGPYLKSKFKYIENEVNKRLGGSPNPVIPTPTPAPAASYPNPPFLVDVLIDNLNIRTSPNGAVTGKYTGKGIFTIVEVSGDWGRLKSGAGWIYLADPSYVRIESNSNIFTPYLVRINTETLNVRKGPGTNYPVVTTVHKPSVYTIVGEENGWGKLKSGVGYICLEYTIKI